MEVIIVKLSGLKLSANVVQCADSITPGVSQLEKKPHFLKQLAGQLMMHQLENRTVNLRLKHNLKFVIQKMLGVSEG